MKNYEFSEKPSRQPEYRVNRDGDVKFERVGDEIVFWQDQKYAPSRCFPAGKLRRLWTVNYWDTDGRW